MSEQNDEDYQSQHHFLSESPWSAQQLMQKISQDTNKLLGEWHKQALSVDENSNRKAGKHSVGVSSQYNGNLGKVENSQTGVFASLSRGNRVGLINCRLFLPEEWVEDEGRCLKAGIPKPAIVGKTKVDLALEMLSETIASGVKFGWINADGLYGQSYKFCKIIDEWGKAFVVDVHKDHHVYLEDPQPYLPAPTSGKGRKPKRLKTELQSIKVEDYLAKVSSGDFREVKIRKGTKGWLKAKVHLATVWVWDGKENHARQRTLIIRKGIKKGEAIKFALSNIAKNEQTPQEFAFMQAQRFWIERAFEDCKGELGMTDYQVRKYNAWYHHQALVMLAMQYINKVKIKNQENIPLISVRDIRLQIIASLKGEGVEMEKEIDQMFIRHKQRIMDIQRNYPENDYF